MSVCIYIRSSSAKHSLCDQTTRQLCPIKYGHFAVMLLKNATRPVH